MTEPATEPTAEELSNDKKQEIKRKIAARFKTSTREKVVKPGPRPLEDCYYINAYGEMVIDKIGRLHSKLDKKLIADINSGE